MKLPLEQSRVCSYPKCESLAGNLPTSSLISQLGVGNYALFVLKFQRNSEVSKSTRMIDDGVAIAP